MMRRRTMTGGEDDDEHDYDKYDNDFKDVYY